jgi:hypothetical protein
MQTFNYKTLDGSFVRIYTEKESNSFSVYLDTNFSRLTNEDMGRNLPPRLKLASRAELCPLCRGGVAPRGEDHLFTLPFF